MDFSNSPSNENDTNKSSIPPERSFPEFEGYQIIEELPRGGQAFVYKAIHKATKAKVALKVLAQGSAASAKVRRRFEREVDLISGLKHPYIVSIRDSGIDKGNYYFAMEYLQGLALDQYVSFEALSFRKTLELFAKICEAISFAHRHGVIHRDLKPSNIIVDKRGDPHILDLGLAKAAGSLGDTISMVSMTGEIQGTLAYMSPEQASGQTDLIDTRTDVYSLGVILYLLLTGKFPYDVSGTTAQILRNIESAEPIRPRKILSKFSSEVQAIILKCLEKNPSHRYHSAADLHDDIRHWLNGEPLAVKSQSLFYITRKLVYRHKYAGIVLGLLLVIFTSNILISLFYYHQSRQSEQLLELNIKKSEQLSQKQMRLANRVMFTLFLDLWRHGEIDRAKATMYSFSEKSKEKIAAEFLLDDRPLDIKKSDFQERISTESQALWLFVLAEHYDKSNNLTMAKEAYSQCVKMSKNSPQSNDWFINRANEKLNQLQKLP